MTHLTRNTSAALGLVALLGLAACSSTPERAEREESPDIEEVYSGSDAQATRDAVEQLRSGLRMDHTRGATDDYVPLRTPDEVIAIYVYPDATSNEDGRRRASGHWQHSVVEWSDWYDAN